MGGESLEIGSDESTGAESELKAKIGRLEIELKAAQAQAADAMAEAASAEAEVITLKAALARAGESGAGAQGDERSVADLEARLKQKAEEYDRLARSLEAEQRRVTELERERELQNKSLRVLHQQLELAKERNQRTAAG